LLFHPDGEDLPAIVLPLGSEVVFSQQEATQVGYYTLTEGGVPQDVQHYVHRVADEDVVTVEIAHPTGQYYPIPQYTFHAKEVGATTLTVGFDLVSGFTRRILVLPEEIFRRDHWYEYPEYDDVPWGGVNAAAKNLQVYEADGDLQGFGGPLTDPFFEGCGVYYNPYLGEKAAAFPYVVPVPYSGDLSMFTTLPTMDLNGDLIFATAPNAHGSAEFEVHLALVDSYGRVVDRDWGWSPTYEDNEHCRFTIEVIPQDDQPTANIGGPYAVTVGQAIALNGSRSRDPDGRTTSWSDLARPSRYEWDLDGDGIFGETGADAARGKEIGERPVFATAGLAAPQEWTVYLRVWDVDGDCSDTVSTTISIMNDVPEITAGEDVTLHSGERLVRAVGIEDQSPGNLEITIDYGDGSDEETLTVATAARSLGLNHVYTSVGQYVVTVHAEDDYGFYNEATFTVEAINAAPKFQSKPVQEALVGYEYSYQALAYDLEGDPLAFSLLGATLGGQPIPDFVCTSTGLVTWIPGVAYLNQTVDVLLQVDDDQGGHDVQLYSIYVGTDWENQNPYFTNAPKTTYKLAAPPDLPTGEVSPDWINANLDFQEEQTYTVTVTRSPQGSFVGDTPYVPPEGTPGVLEVYPVAGNGDPSDGSDYEDVGRELVNALFYGGNSGGDASNPGITINNVVYTRVTQSNTVEWKVFEAADGSDWPNQAAWVYLGEGVFQPLTEEERLQASTLSCFRDRSDTYGLGPVGIVMSTGDANMYGSKSDDGVYSLRYDSWEESGQNPDYPYVLADGTTWDNMLHTACGDTSGTFKFYDPTVLEIDLSAGVCEQLLFDVVYGSEEYEGNVVRSEQGAMPWADGFGLFLQELDEYGQPTGALLNLAEVAAFGPPMERGNQEVPNFEHVTRQLVPEVGDPLPSILPGRDVLPDGQELDEAFVQYIDSLNLPDFPPGSIPVSPWPINTCHPQMRYSDGTELNAVLVPYGQTDALIHIQSALTPGKDYRLTILLADSNDPKVDTTVYVCNLGGKSAEPITVGVEAVGENLDDVFESITPSVSGVWHGEEAVFDVALRGDGVPRTFFLQFTDITPGHAGDILGTIPVAINTDYYCDLDAGDNNPDDVLTYTLTAKPDETATIDSLTGEVSWRPTSTGVFDFCVVVEDGQGGSAEMSWSVEVTSALENNAPEFSEAEKPPVDVPLVAQVGREFALQVEATDPDAGSQLEYYLVDGTFPKGSGDSQMRIDRHTGRISWTPSPAQVGLWQDGLGSPLDVTVVVFDRCGGMDQYTFRIEVCAQAIAFNAPPEIDPLEEEITLWLGDDLRLPVRVTDPNHDAVAIRVNGPEGLFYDEQSSTIIWPRDAVRLGTFSVTVWADDGRHGYDSDVVLVNVYSADDPPIFCTPELPPAFQDALFDVRLDVRDPHWYAITNFEIVRDGSLHATNVPVSEDLAINSTTGRITWTPSSNIEWSGGAAIFWIKIKATNELGVAAVRSYEVVAYENAPPELHTPPTLFPKAGESFSYSFTVTDPNPGDQVNIVSATCNIAQETLNVANVPGTDEWLLTWIAPEWSEGRQVCFEIVFEDDHAAQSTFLLDLSVVDQNAVPRPMLAGPTPAIEILAGREFKCPMCAPLPSDVAIGDIFFSLAVFTDEECSTLWDPAGPVPTIDGKGLIEWTPVAEQAGQVYYLKSWAETLDGSNRWIPPMVVAVAVKNAPERTPEIISPAPREATIGYELVYQPELVENTDTDLDWYLDEKPEGMVINPSTGEVTWTPTAKFFDKTVDVRIRVIDSVGDGWFQKFSIRVRGSVHEPTIDTTFPSVWPTGESLEFRVAVGNPDELCLTYRLLNEVEEPLSGDYDISIDEDGWIHWDSPTAGEHTFVVAVADKYQPACCAKRTFTLTVVDAIVNREPIIRGNPDGRCASVGQEFEYVFDGYDPDDPENGTITFEIVAGQIGDMAFDENTPGRFTWTPTSETDAQIVSIVARDDQGAASEPVMFILKAMNDAPPIMAAERHAYPVLGQQFFYEIVASDPENGPLTFTIDRDPDRGNVPAAVRIDREKGFLWWQIPQDGSELPEDNTPGDGTWTYNVPIVVSDQYGATATQTLTIEVSNEDTVAPTIVARVIDADNNIVLPGEELDVNSRYWVIVDISDNCGEAALNGDATEITIFDVAALEIPGEYLPIGGKLEYGCTWVDFTVGGLNQGNIHFRITAEDTSGNKASRSFTYYASDTSEAPPVKMLEFQDADDPLTTFAFDEPITKPINVLGVANMGYIDEYEQPQPYNYELILYTADDDYEVVTIEDESQRWYQLECKSDYVVISSGSAEVPSPACLGTLDPALYGSGMYRLVLAIVSSSAEGHYYQAIDERFIEIQNDARLQDLDLSFTDLAVTLGGIPISLVRSYSSAEVGLGADDFGPGWSLDFARAGIDVGHFNRATNSLNEAMARDTRVLVTLPDGTIQRFTFDPIPVGTSEYAEPYFRPDDDTQCTLEIGGLDDSLLIMPVQHGKADYQGPYTIANSGEEFVPHQSGSVFVLRTPGGLEYHYDMQSGRLTAIQNDSGQRVEISPITDDSPGGTQPTTTTQTITTADGAQSISIIRNEATGRIQSISDLKSQVIQYGYVDDEAGDVYNIVAAPDGQLGWVTLRDASTVKYGYENAAFADHLTGIIDNTDVAVLTVTYDLDGFVESASSAGGASSSVEFNRALGGGLTERTIQPKDALDNVLGVTKEIYNARGNLVCRAQALEIDAQGDGAQYLVTSYVYTKLSGLLLRESVPYIVAAEDYGTDLVITEDELDDVTDVTWARILTYDQDKNDSNGRFGVLTSSTDALGNTTAYTYDSDNRLLTTIDPAGNTTHNVYDAYTGNLRETYTTSPRPAGEGQGEGGSTVRLNWTRYTYLYGMPLATYRVSSDGQTETLVAQTEYNDAWRVASTTDASGVTRYFGYDANGNQTHSWHNWTDPAGAVHTIVSRTTYDANDRVIETAEFELVGAAAITSPAALDTALAGAEELWTTSTHYNDRGLVDSSTDRYGVQTQTTFNADGNATETRTEATDENGVAGWLVSRTLYDAQGRAEFATDAQFVTETQYTAGIDALPWFGSRTVYDPAGRTIRTERHAGILITLDAGATALPAGFDWDTSGTEISNSQTFYDAHGRTDYTVDDYGIQTHYVYDASGRQIQTHYQSLDEDGQPCWVVTRTIYDALGRAAVTSDPFVVAGAAEPQSDDPMPAGLGTLTTYDALGRSVKTERLDGLVIKFTDPSDPKCTPNTPSWTTTGVLWSTESVYNALGQVIQSVGRHGPDEAGLITEYVYDSDGRQIESRYQSRDEDDNLCWVVTRTVYNDRGQPLFTTDPYVAGNGVDAPPAESPAVLGTRTTYDARGRAVQTERIEGLVVDITDPDAPAWSVSGVLWSTETVYNNLGQMTQSIDRHAPGESGPVTDYLYDAQGRQVAVIHPLATDAVTGLPEHTDSLGRPVRHLVESVYDGNRRLHSTVENITVVANADGSLYYDAQSELVIDRSDAHTTSYTYDDLGRTIRTTLADGSFTATTYDVHGRRIAETEQLASGTNVVWSEADGSYIVVGSNPVELVPTRCFEYDAAGGLAAVVLPEVEHPDPAIDMVHPRYEYTYDALGRHVATRDGVYQIFTGPSAGIYRADSRVTEFGYDAAGNQTSRQLPEGVAAADGSFTETMVYDDFGRLDYAVSFEEVVTDHVYDTDDGLDPGDSGRLAATHYFATVAAHQAWLANPTTATPPAESTFYTYDAFGNVRSVIQDTDGDADPDTTTGQRRTDNDYDAEGRLVTVVSPEGTIHYEYDPITDEHVRTWTGADQESIITDTHYAYDSLERLDTVTLDRRNGVAVTPEVTDYVYDLLGNLDEVHQSNGVTSDYTYDVLGRLELLRHYKDLNTDGDYDPGADALLTEFDYDLLANGRRSGVTEKQYDPVSDTIKETRIDWLYDNLGRLTREIYDLDPTTATDDDFVANYVLDLVGNRLEKKTDLAPSAADMAAYHADAADVALVETNEQVSSTFDANDRLLTETKDADGTDDDRFTVYHYGPDGNSDGHDDWTQQTTKIVHEGLDDTGDVAESTTYAYNLQGRMSQASVDADGDGAGAAVVTEYTYDADGIRVSQTEDGVETVYLNDKNNPTGYSQVLEEKNAAGTVTKTYTLGHDVIAQQAVAVVDGSTVTLLYDGHGSTRALLDEDGQVVNSGGPQVFRYDAFGVRLDAVTALTSLLYSGEQTDALTGLQFLRARYYDPATGRFNRLDPFAGNMQDPMSLHKYLYCMANPVMGADPTGQSPLALTPLGLITVQRALDVGSASIFTVGTYAFLLRTLFDFTQNEGPWAGRESDAYVLSLSASALASLLPRNRILGSAGIGFTTKVDVLWIKNDPGRVHVYIAPGVTIGTWGVMGTLEVGVVWDVDGPKDYAGPFISCTATATFPGARFGSGIWSSPFLSTAAQGGSATVFYAPNDFFEGAYGVSFGYAAGGTWQTTRIPYTPPVLMPITGGVGYGTTLSYYFHLRSFAIAPALQAALGAAQSIGRVGPLMLDALR